MDVKTAIDKVDSGEIFRASIFELWEIENALATSNTSESTTALKTFKKIVEGTKSLTEKSYDEKTADAAEQVRLNQRELDGIKASYNPLHDEKDEDVRKINNFVNNVSIENKQGFDAVSKEDFRSDFFRLAELQAEHEIIQDAKFASYSTKEQKSAYRSALVNVLQMNAVELVQQQIIEDEIAAVTPDKNGKILPMIKLDHLEKVNTKAKEIFSSIASGDKFNFSLSNANILGTLSGKMKRAKEFGDAILTKTGIKEVVQDVVKFDEELTKKHPNTWPLLKGMAVSFIGGPTGMAVYGGYYTYKTIKTQAKAAKEAKMSYFQYLKKNPSQIAILGAGVVGTAISGYGAVASGLNAGILSDVVAGNVVGDGSTLGRLAAPFQGDAAATAKIGTFFGGVANTLTNPTYLARLGTNLTATLAVSGEYFSKAYNAKNPEERKKHLQEAKRTMLRAGTGIAIGTAMGAYMSVGAETAHHVVDTTPSDGHATAPVTSEGHTAPVTSEGHNTPVVDKDGDGISDHIDRDGGEGWANGDSKTHPANSTDNTSGEKATNVSDVTYSHSNTTQHWAESRMSLVPNADVMVANIESGAVVLPEGMSPEVAVSVARLYNQYYDVKYNADSEILLKILINCDEVQGMSVEQKIDIFNEKAALFNLESGNGMKLGHPLHLDNLNCNRTIYNSIDCEGVAKTIVYNNCGGQAVHTPPHQPVVHIPVEAPVVELPPRIIPNIDPVIPTLVDVPEVKIPEIHITPVEPVVHVEDPQNPLSPLTDIEKAQLRTHFESGQDFNNYFQNVEFKDADGHQYNHSVWTQEVDGKSVMMKGPVVEEVPYIPQEGDVKLDLNGKHFDDKSWEKFVNDNNVYEDAKGAYWSVAKENTPLSALEAVEAAHGKVDGELTVKGKAGLNQPVNAEIKHTHSGQQTKVPTR